MAARKNYTAAQIINGLRRAEVGLANGKSMKEVIRDLGVSEQTYYRWRREYGGMKTSQEKRLKELEKENHRLKRAVERVEVKTLYIEPGSPWENGYNESFNGTLGEEVLKREIFYSLEEAKVLTEQWRREYNTIRPHSSLRYRPPAPEALRPDPFFLNLPKLNGPHPRLQEAVGLTQ